MHIVKTIGACALLGASFQAGAAVLFSEDFDSITSTTLQLTTTAGSMTVTGGVDAVVPLNPYGIVAGSTVIDLDGSPGPGRVGKDGFSLLAGEVYTLSFVLGGAQRGSGQDNWFLELYSDAPAALQSVAGSGLLAAAVGGPLSNVFTFSAFIAGNAPFTLASIDLRANVNTSFGFAIGTSSSDNIGPLLDSVTLTRNAVPEPASWALLMAGLGLAMVARRGRATELLGRGTD